MCLEVSKEQLRGQHARDKWARIGVWIDEGKEVMRAGQASVSPLDLTLSKIHWRVWKQERLPSEEVGCSVHNRLQKGREDAGRD